MEQTKRNPALVGSDRVSRMDFDGLKIFLDDNLPHIFPQCETDNIDASKYPIIAAHFFGILPTEEVG